MQQNIAFTDDHQITILDESLINYGLAKGEVVPLRAGKPELNGVPVWELDGALQARFIQHDWTGWARAYTAFLSSGKICYSLAPDKVGRVKPVGWIGQPDRKPR